MGLNYQQLDLDTRREMLAELDRDIAGGLAYISPRLAPGRTAEYLGLLRQAIISHNDDWLAAQLRKSHLLPPRVMRGGQLVALPGNAHDMLAEGEFNRYYIRGLARLALDMPGSVLEIYRARPVKEPRPESEQRVGATVSPAVTLIELTTPRRFDVALGVPGGPNSGLTVRLRRSA